MRIYVSGSIRDRERVREVQADLSAVHEITHDWTRWEPGLGDELEEIERQVDGIYDADVVVLVEHPHGKGKYMEVGMALGHTIPVVVMPHPDVGPSLFWQIPRVVEQGSMSIREAVRVARESR